MGREIKFRFWDGTSGNEVMCYMNSLGQFIYPGSGFPLPFQQAIKEALEEEGYNKPKAFMQYTGLKDKNGVEIYEGDILGVRYQLGEDKDNHFTYSGYEVSISPLHGIKLNYTKLLGDDKENQHPINMTLSSEYGSLREDYRNEKYDQLAVMDTSGENHIFGNRWKENHYSNDIKVIGNIYENPELLENKEK